MKHNSYHRTIKMTPNNVKPDFYAEYYVGSNEENHRFQVGDHVRILKYKNIFCQRMYFKLVRRSLRN